MFHDTLVPCAERRNINMIKELIKIKENNNIVSIFCDEDDTSMFLEGYIYAIGRQDF